MRTSSKNDEKGGYSLDLDFVTISYYLCVSSPRGKWAR